MNPSVTITYASLDDLAELKKLDKHISSSEFAKAQADNRVLVIKFASKLGGWLRYNLFWDNTPFLNMLEILPAYRQQNYGRRLVEFWENSMKQQDYHLVMTSSLSNETAQHFYRKLGYRDAGTLILDNQAAEIIFTKELL